MEITFDPAKRDWTLRERGVDFADVPTVMLGAVLTVADDRVDYGEPRFITYGRLQDRLVMFAWTPVDGAIRVISMRKCNEREQRKFAGRLG